MKKSKKISYETRFWADFKAGNPFEAFDALFDFAYLDYYKQHLSQAVLYCYKGQIYKQEVPGHVFVFYTAISSFLKVCYSVKGKGKKWKVNPSVRTETVFHFSSLTKEEHDNPFLALQNAFKERTLQEFEFFLYEIIELSLYPNNTDPGTDLATPYIHLIKMLDAAALIRERGVERIKKKEAEDAEVQRR